MLDIGGSELLVVAIVAIVVVGPKDLPKLMRTLGFYAGKIRRTAADFQRQFNEAMAESEADEVRKNIEAIRANMGTTEDWQASAKPLMTGEPGRTALGAPPLGAQQAEAPPKRTPAKKAAKKQAAKKAAPRKTKAAAKKPASKKAPAKAKTKASSKAKPKR